MYANFFGLKQAPFSIAPDPRYLFMSERHREALAHLLYGTGGGGGFVLLTGEIGAGKTTVCRCFLEQIPRRCNVAYIFNPKLTVIELLKSVCDEFHVACPARDPGEPALTVKDYLDPLNDFLLKTHAAGLNNILIIDEAQHLSAEVLEQLRLLTNLETNERKLLQIILIGQPELRGMLARPELEQLAQRVIARFHLEALSEAETSQYIRHRLAIAGLPAGAMPFDSKARCRIHELSRGVPRRINLLCDRALLGAYSAGRAVVDRATVDQAAREVFGHGSPSPAAGRPASRWRLGPAALLALGMVGTVGAVGAAAVWGLQQGRDGHIAALLAPVPASPAASMPATPAASAGSRPGAERRASSTAPTASSVAGSVPNFEPLVRDQNEAWRELAALWALNLADSAAPPCEAVKAQQVQCFKSANTLAMIRQLGRPGLLTLHDDKGRAAYALLTALGPEGATLRVAGVSQTLPLKSLTQLWQGEFSTFWRAPAGYRGAVSAGQSGPVVDALAGQLAQAAGETPPPPKAVFDAALRSRLIAFQVAQGLQPDGVAGPTTFMQLNRALGVNEPRLGTEAPKN